MSIHIKAQKIKSWFYEGRGREVVLVLIILFASIGSFLLGRLSVLDENGNQVIINFDPGTYGLDGVEENTLPSPSKNENSAGSGEVLSSERSSANESGPGVAEDEIVASKRGTKYYFVWCSGAKSLSETNKIYFKTEAEAQQAGYTKSTSCK